MYQKKRLSLAVSAALGFSTLLMIPGQALAQDQSAEMEEMAIEEVIVTGSRLKHVDGFGQTSPVTVVGMEEISRTGLTRMEDVLKDAESDPTLLQDDFLGNANAEGLLPGGHGQQFFLGRKGGLEGEAADAFLGFHVRS